MGHEEKSNAMKSTHEGSPEFEKFGRFVRAIVNVPHAEVRRKLEREKKHKAEKKRLKTRASSRASGDSSGL
jgi:hypothetical protein